MRLDHVPASSLSLASNSESGSLDRESGQPNLRISDFTPGLGLRLRRNAENSAIEASRLEYPSAPNNPGSGNVSGTPHLNPSSRVLLHGINPLPPSVQHRLQVNQRDQVITFTFRVDNLGIFHGTFQYDMRLYIKCSLLEHHH